MTTSVPLAAGSYDGQVVKVGGTWFKWANGQWVPAGSTGHGSTGPDGPLGVTHVDTEPVDTGDGDTGDPRVATETEAAAHPWASDEEDV